MGKRVDKEVWRVGREEEDEVGGGNSKGKDAFEVLGEANAECSSSSTTLHAIRRPAIGLKREMEEIRKGSHNLNFAKSKSRKSNSW